MPDKLYPNLKVGGAAAPDGTRYIGIVQNGEEWLAPHKALLTDTAQIFQSLAEQGMPIGGRGFVAQVQDDVHRVNDFPEREILREPGWNGSIYARANGDVLAPKAAVQTGAAPGIGFHRHPNHYSCAGSPKEWKRKAAPHLLSDPAVTLLIGISFAPVFRSLSSRSIAPIACQFVAERQSNIVRRVALSVVGSMNAGALEPDPIEKLLRAPDHYIKAARDNVLVLGDIGSYLAGGSDKKRIAAVRSLVFDRLLPNGGGLLNAMGEQAPSFIIVENRPLADLLGLDSEVASRLNQRVPLINVPSGAIDSHNNETDNKALADWRAAIGIFDYCYGHTLLNLQRQLVEKRGNKGVVAIQKHLDNDLPQFWAFARKKIADIDVAEDLVNPFALGYAALQAAQRLKVLPKSADTRAAVVSVFKRFLVERPRVPTAASILAGVSLRSDVLKIEDIEHTMSKAELQNVPAFIKTGRNGKRELWVPTAQKKEVFDWPVFSKLHDFNEWFRGKGEKDRDGGKRVIGAWKDARVLRFKLP